MPFTKKISNGRGYALRIRPWAKKLGYQPDDYISNGSVICDFISRAFNNFNKKLKRHPKDEHENLVIILEACYPLFRNKINLHDLQNN